MEIEKTIQLNGESGTAYNFTIYPWYTTLFCSGVVYAVIQRNKIGYSVIYIGNTTMLCNHITNHPLLTDFDEAGTTHIGIHIEPSALMRQIKQKDLIENFSPQLNSYLK